MTSHDGNSPAFCRVRFLFLLQYREVNIINVLSEILHKRLVCAQSILCVRVPACDFNALSVEVSRWLGAIKRDSPDLDITVADDSIENFKVNLALRLIVVRPVRCGPRFSA